MRNFAALVEGPGHGDLVSSAAMLEYEDSNGSRRWRFYIGDVESLDSVLRGLRFGTANGFIAVCNVHMFIGARCDEGLASAIHSASFAICDGQPIAWLAGMIAARPVQRITGPDVLRRILLEGGGPPRIALVGGKPSSLIKIKTLLRDNNKDVIVIDPGIVPANGTPDEHTLAALMRFAPDIVFVALGCPKQEKWASAAARIVPSTFIAVGAAFEVLAGELLRPPLILQKLGLEWLYRLIQQPRLFRRYITTNGPFIVLLVKTIIRRQIQAAKRSYHLGLSGLIYGATAVQDFLNWS
jgi:N-acetylglucosaminyldiphosphoundecaprenol N-acetyl-beta-D-mannosaminyltransferase